MHLYTVLGVMILFNCELCIRVFSAFEYKAGCFRFVQTLGREYSLPSKYMGT